MMRVPEAPRPPLSIVGDTLEGRLLEANKARDPWGNDVLEIVVDTPDGPVRYQCKLRLWEQISGKEVNRLRITRIEDSPAFGNKNPAKNYTVELLPEPVTIPLRTTDHPAPQAVTGPAW